MKIKINGFLAYKKPYSWEGDKAHGFHFFHCEMDENDYVTVRPHEFEVDAPDDFDPRPQQVARLQAEQRQVRAEFAARIIDLDRQISQLTCLEAE